MRKIESAPVFAAASCECYSTRQNGLVTNWFTLLVTLMKVVEIMQEPAENCTSQICAEGLMSKHLSSKTVNSSSEGFVHTEGNYGKVMFK